MDAQPVDTIKEYERKYAKFRKTDAAEPQNVSGNSESGGPKTQVATPKEKQRQTTFNDLGALRSVLEQKNREPKEQKKVEKGESEMAGVSTKKEIVTINKGSEIAITDELNVNLTTFEIEACALAGIDLKDFIGKSKDDIKAAWEKNDYFIDGDRILYKGKPVIQSEIDEAKRKLIIVIHSDKNYLGDKKKSDKLFQSINDVFLEDGKISLLHNTKKYPNINEEYWKPKTPLGLEDKQEKLEIVQVEKPELPVPVQTPVNQPAEDLHWIDEKKADYTKMKNEGNADIKEFNGDKATNTFTAEVDNGTVTYTSKNDVTITKDSSYKVFETVMREPSNKGKVIGMPQSATDEFKMNLFAAAILNDHEVTVSAGFEFKEELLAKMPISEEQKAAVRDAFAKLAEKPEPEKTEEKPAAEKEEKVSQNVADRLAHIVSRKNMVEALGKGEAESVRTENPSKPTYMLKPEYMKRQSDRTK